MRLTNEQIERVISELSSRKSDFIQAEVSVIKGNLLEILQLRKELEQTKKELEDVINEESDGVNGVV